MAHVTISDLTARDLASNYTYSADRVTTLVVDDNTVLAVGFTESGRTTGRVVWLHRRSGSHDSIIWRATKCEPCDGCSVAMYAKERLASDEDMTALIAWLRGEA